MYSNIKNNVGKYRKNKQKKIQTNALNILLFNINIHSVDTLHTIGIETPTDEKNMALCERHRHAVFHGILGFFTSYDTPIDF